MTVMLIHRPKLAMLRQQLAETQARVAEAETMARLARCRAVEADEAARFDRAQATLLRRHIAEIEQRLLPAGVVS